MSVEGGAGTAGRRRCHFGSADLQVSRKPGEERVFRQPSCSETLREKIPASSPSQQTTAGHVTRTASLEAMTITQLFDEKFPALIGFSHFNIIFLFVFILLCFHEDF